MPCIDDHGRWPHSTCWPAALLLALGLAGCQHAPSPSPAPAPVSTAQPRPPTGNRAASPVPAPAPPAVAGQQRLPAAPRHPVRNWDEYQRGVGVRLVQANPDKTYLGLVPEPLLAIPVLEVELNADGSVRKINVMRRPSQAFDTVQLAIDAVHRAAPFGPVGHLPKPWRFSEIFLFDDQRRFKPRTLEDD